MIQVGWPQLIWLLLAIGGVAYSCAKHGQPKKQEKHNGLATALGACLAFGLLYWGGFFG